MVLQKAAIPDVNMVRANTNVKDSRIATHPPGNFPRKAAAADKTDNTSSVHCIPKGSHHMQHFGCSRGQGPG